MLCGKVWKVAISSSRPLEAARKCAIVHFSQSIYMRAICTKGGVRPAAHIGGEMQRGDSRFGRPLTQCAHRCRQSHSALLWANAIFCGIWRHVMTFTKICRYEPVRGQHRFSAIGTSSGLGTGASSQNSAIDTSGRDTAPSCNPASFSPTSLNTSDSRFLPTMAPLATHMPTPLYSTPSRVPLPFFVWAVPLTPPS